MRCLIPFLLLVASAGFRLPEAAGPDGGWTIWPEAHPDSYGRGGDPWLELFDAAERAGLLGELDWERVSQVMARAEGIARPVHARQTN